MMMVLLCSQVSFCLGVGPNFALGVARAVSQYDGQEEALLLPLNSGQNF